MKSESEVREMLETEKRILEGENSTELAKEVAFAKASAFMEVLEVESGDVDGLKRALDGWEETAIENMNSDDYEQSLQGGAVYAVVLDLKRYLNTGGDDE